MTVIYTMILVGGQAMHPFGDNMVVYAVRGSGLFLDNFNQMGKTDAYKMDLSDRKSNLHSNSKTLRSRISSTTK